MILVVTLVVGAVGCDEDDDVFTFLELLEDGIGSLLRILAYVT